MFQYLLSAVKRGSFDGDWRKELTAFLTWTIINNYSVAPFTAIKEQAYFKNDNMSGNKELDLFNYLYDDVTVPTIINSFYSEGVKFVGKSFGDATNDERVSFVKESADYYFLYAAVLHLVYEVKAGASEDIQFEKVITWYFDNCLISGYALTYMIIYFSKDGIGLPHNVNAEETEKIINGCKNEAMDLFYLQQLDPRRYPSGMVSIMLATTDVLLKRLFEEYLVANTESGGDVLKFYNVLCDSLEDSKKKKYVDILTAKSYTHKTLPVNESNALGIAKEIAMKEETRLRDFLEERNVTIET